jgi:uncharacterized membrane protein
MQIFRGAVLVLATLATGLMAGVFGLYSHTIMPGLRRTDDRTFVGAFQSVDRAIINPWFLPTYLGALALTALSVLLSFGAEVRAVLPWLVSAFVLYLATVVVTVTVHLPRNDALKAAGEPDHIADLSAVRQRFDEVRWTSWNLVRTLASMSAFACLAWALVVYGRHT